MKTTYSFRTNETGNKAIDFNGEEFQVIPNTKDCYAVSRSGKIISLKHDEPMYLNPGKLNNYQYVNINVAGKFTVRYVHRLVAEAFIPNPEKKRTVNHIDENKSNNNVENLEWMTYSENCSYGSRPSVISARMKELYKDRGVANTHPVAALDSHDKFVFCFPSIDLAARYTGREKYKSVKTQISYCVAGKKHCLYAAGYKWTTIDQRILEEFYANHPDFMAEIQAMAAFIENVRNLERDLKHNQKELCKFVVKQTEKLIRRSSRQTIVLAKGKESNEIEGVYASMIDALRFNCPENADATNVGRLRYAMNNGNSFSGYIWLLGDDSDIKKYSDFYCAKLNDFVFQEPKFTRH